MNAYLSGETALTPYVIITVGIYSSCSFCLLMNVLSAVFLHGVFANEYY